MLPEDHSSYGDFLKFINRLVDKSGNIRIFVNKNGDGVRKIFIDLLRDLFDGKVSVLFELFIYGSFHSGVRYIFGNEFVYIVRDNVLRVP